MLDALVETIAKCYADSVALAIVYGSYVTGQVGPKSDVDVVFIGKDERAFEMQRTFIFEGVGYDFWCMPEARLRRIVDEFQPLVSIFAEGRLVYADTPERKACFADLQQRLRTAGQDARPTRFARQIEELLRQAKALAFDHRFAGRAEKRHIQGRLVLLAGDLLARVNGTYFRFGIKKYLDEITGFELKPQAALRHLELMLGDVVGTVEMDAFVLGMQEFWTGVRQRHDQPLAADDLQGFYEEGISTWNKIDGAAERGDLPLTVLAATCMENELAGFRARGVSLTSMFAGSPTTPMGIARNAEANQREFVEALNHRGIPIVQLGDIAEVVNHIRSGTVGGAAPTRGE